MITVLNLLPIPLPALAREAITRTKTSIGAIAFNAPTKTSPKTPTIPT